MGRASPFTGTLNELRGGPPCGTPHVSSEADPTWQTICRHAESRHFIVNESVCALDGGGADGRYMMCFTANCPGRRLDAKKKHKLSEPIEYPGSSTAVPAFECPPRAVGARHDGAAKLLRRQCSTRGLDILARRPSRVARRPSPVARRPSRVARRPSRVARYPSPASVACLENLAASRLRRRAFGRCRATKPASRAARMAPTPAFAGA